MSRKDKIKKIKTKRNVSKRTAEMMLDTMGENWYYQVIERRTNGDKRYQQT